MAMEKKLKKKRGIEENPKLPEFAERRKGYAEPRPLTRAEAEWIGVSGQPKDVQERYKIERIYTTTKGGKKVIFDFIVSVGKKGDVEKRSIAVDFKGNEYLYASVTDDRKIPFPLNSKNKENVSAAPVASTPSISEAPVPVETAPAPVEKKATTKLEEKQLNAIDHILREKKWSYTNIASGADVFLGEADVIRNGIEKDGKYILSIDVFVENQKTGDGVMKPLMEINQGWVRKSVIDKAIAEQKNTDVLESSPVVASSLSAESEETIFNREYASMLSVCNASKEALYAATAATAETAVTTHYNNWLKLKYMDATKKIAPIALTKEDLEAVLKNARTTAPKPVAGEKKPEPIVSPYVEPVQHEPKKEEPAIKKEEPAAVFSTEKKEELTVEDRKKKEVEIFEKITEEISLNYYEKDLFENGYPLESIIINQISFYDAAIKEFDEKNADGGSIRVHKERIQNLKKLNDFLIELGVKPKMVASKEDVAKINAKEESDLKDIAPKYEYLLKQAKEGNIQFILSKGPRTIYYKNRGSSAVSYYVQGTEYALEPGFQARFSKSIDEKYNTEVWDPVKSNTELEKLLKAELGVLKNEKVKNKEEEQPVFTAGDLVLRNKKVQIERKRQEDLDYNSIGIRADLNQALKDPSTSEDEKKNIREYLADIEKFLNDCIPKVEKSLKENPDNAEAKEFLLYCKQRLENIHRINKRYDEQLLELEKPPIEEESVFDPSVIEKLNEAIRKRGISGMRHGSEFLDLLASKLEYPGLDEELGDIIEKARKK